MMFYVKLSVDGTLALTGTTVMELPTLKLVYWIKSKEALAGQN